jgi:hypothetical protein
MRKNKALLMWAAHVASLTASMFAKPRLGFSRMKSRGVRIACVDAGQNARDFRHERSLAELRFMVTSCRVT